MELENQLWNNDQIWENVPKMVKIFIYSQLYRRVQDGQTSKDTSHNFAHPGGSQSSKGGNDTFKPL